MTDDDPIDAALALDLLAGYLSSSGSLINGLEALAHVVPGCQPLLPVAIQLTLGTPWDTAWAEVADHPELKELGNQLKFVHFTAVPTAHVLVSAAQALRRHRKRKAEQLAAELAIRMVVPMGVCLLPAFICLGVIPMMISLFP